jgi:hypothetical protein
MEGSSSEGSGYTSEQPQRQYSSSLPRAGTGGPDGRLGSERHYAGPVDQTLEKRDEELGVHAPGDGTKHNGSWARPTETSLKCTLN